MSAFRNVTSADLSAKIDEYHLLSTEVIGGLSAEVIALTGRVDALEETIRNLHREFAEFKSSMDRQPRHLP
jgi:hypothetical protein